MTDTWAGDFADIARELHEEPDLAQTLDRIVELACESVECFSVFAARIKSSARRSSSSKERRHVRARGRRGRRRSAWRGRGGDSGFSSAASASASAQDEPPLASVLPISTVTPLRGWQHVTEAGRRPAMAFSTAGMRTRSRTGSPRAMTIAASASAAPRRPCPSSSAACRLDGLMSRPPVSKPTPLPTIVTWGWPASPQVRSTSRGARRLARPTAWITGKFRSSSASPTTAVIVAACRAAISCAPPAPAAPDPCRLPGC